MNNRNINDYLERLGIMKDEALGIKRDITVKERKAAEEYATAFWETMHTGMPHNALKFGSDGSGGYLVPDTYEKSLVKALSEKNIFRKISTTIPTTHKLIIPISMGSENATWITENEPYKFSTSIKVSDEMLEDGGVNLEKYIKDIFAERIGDAEEDAFVHGDGNGKPLGLIYQAPVGVVTAEKGKITADDLVDLEYSVSAGHRKHGVWVMSNDAYSRVSQIVHHRGDGIWSKGLDKADPMKLLGHPVYICNAMDDVAPGTIPVMFGDFRYFIIGDRGKRVIKRLVERYAERGQVAFITSQRVDAKLLLPKAIKLLKVKGDEE